MKRYEWQIYNAFTFLCKEIEKILEETASKRKETKQEVYIFDETLLEYSLKFNVFR